MRHPSIGRGIGWGKHEWELVDERCKKLHWRLKHLHNYGFEAKLQPNCVCCERLQENSIPWKQQVVGMACDAFWIEECTCLLLASHGPSSRKGIFPEVLHRWRLNAFSLLITIREVCMFKFETSLLGVNNVIEWEFPSPFNSSCFLHPLFRTCSIIGHVI